MLARFYSALKKKCILSHNEGGAEASGDCGLLVYTVDDKEETTTHLPHMEETLGEKYKASVHLCMCSICSTVKYFMEAVWRPDAPPPSFTVCTSRPTPPSCHRTVLKNTTHQQVH